MYLLKISQDNVVDVIKNIDLNYKPKENEVLIEKIEYPPINKDEIGIMKYKDNKVYFEIKKRVG